MKKNKIVISIIISIGVILTVIALILNLNPKKEETISIKTIKNFYNKVEDYFSSDDIDISNIFKEDGVYKVVTETEYKEGSKPVVAKGNIYYDNKKIYSKLKATYEKEDFAFTGLYDDNKLYFNIDKISENYYYKDIDIKSNQLSISEIKELLSLSFNLITNQFEDANVKKSNESIKINNKSIDTEKNSIDIDGKNKNKIIDELIAIIEVSEKFRDSSKSTIIDKLEEYKVGSLDENTTSITIELFVKDNDVIATNIIDYNESTNTHIEIYRNDNDKNILNIEYYKKDKKEYALMVTKVSVRESNIYIYYDSKYEINVKAITADNVIHLDGTIKELKGYQKEDIGSFSIDYGMIELNKEYSLTIKLDIDSSSKKLKINSENKIYLDELAPQYSIDTDNINNINKMTPEEKLQVIKYFGLDLFK